MIVPALLVPCWLVETNETFYHVENVFQLYGRDS